MRAGSALLVALLLGTPVQSLRAAEDCLEWHYRGLRLGMSVERASQVLPPTVPLSPQVNAFFGQPWRADGLEWLYLEFEEPTREPTGPVVAIRIVRVTNQGLGDLREYWHSPSRSCETKLVTTFEWEDRGCGILAQATDIEGVQLITLRSLVEP